MKRIRTITIATVMGAALGFTSLSGTASAASLAPNASNGPVVLYTSQSKPCFSYQWLPYTMNGYGNQPFMYPIKWQIPTQPKQTPKQTPKQKQTVPVPAQKQPIKQPIQQPKQPIQSGQPAQTQPAPSSQQNQAASFTQRVADLVNQERAKAGLAPLQMDESLNKVAQAKAADMAQNKYFSHNSPTYGSPFDMMKQFGISYRTAGENIAMGQRSPEEVMSQWMNSPGHRQNILNGSFTKIGVGYVNGYWVQTFAG